MQHEVAELTPEEQVLYGVDDFVKQGFPSAYFNLPSNPILSFHFRTYAVPLGF
jgi:hypothetical protein